MRDKRHFGEHPHGDLACEEQKHRRDQHADEEHVNLMHVRLKQQRAGGQALDLEAEGAALNLQQLELIHQHKTGCLIRASVAMGALTHPQVSARQLEALDRYAQAVGLAFQVQDDILDEIGDTDILGKPQGSDRAQTKATYVSLLGLDQAKTKAAELANNAIEAIEGISASANSLDASSTGVSFEGYNALLYFLCLPNTKSKKRVSTV